MGQIAWKDVLGLFWTTLISNGLRWGEKLAVSCLSASELRWCSESLSPSKQYMPQKQDIGQSWQVGRDSGQDWQEKLSKEQLTMILYDLS